MAGLEVLVKKIYHEKQQEGSMLCAQHALNALLQENYFSAPDLSIIAQKLDRLEQHVHTERRSTRSANMDDTGFFSVQVMEEALQHWGLRMVHWRSPEMQAAQNAPSQQFAFILNLEQHWFTIRRFGYVEEIDEATPEEADRCHWFNLNSFLNAPEWIGKLYLGMMLQQAEQEGYSVYVIRRTDQTSPLDILKTSVDEIASTLPQPRSAATVAPRLATKHSTSQPSAGTSRPAEQPLSGVEGFEDEDMHLQAALQASLSGHEIADLVVPTPTTASSSRAPIGFTPPPTFTMPDMSDHTDAHDASDPIASSMARQRAAMNQMLRHQQAAFRETYDDEVQQMFGHQQNRYQPLSSHQTLPEDRDEQEQIRQAMANSQKDPTDVISDDEDDDEDYVTPGEVTPPQSAPPQRAAPAPQAQRFADHTGVYDDDDAALQAALRASLEDMPEGSTVPSSPPSVIRRPVEAQAPPVEHSSATHDMDTEDDGEGDDSIDDTDMDEDAKDSVQTEQPAHQSPKVDVDEMRRMRLARFGGPGPANGDAKGSK